MMLTDDRTAAFCIFVSFCPPPRGHFVRLAILIPIGWLNFVMAVLPFTAGCVPKRWHKGTDVMLLKKEELFLIDKLHTIASYCKLRGRFQHVSNP